MDTKGTTESIEEAERLYKEVIAGRSEHYGPGHVETLLTKGNLANLLQNKGQVDDARDSLREVVAGMAQQLSPEHPWLVHFRRQLTELDASRE